MNEVVIRQMDLSTSETIFWVEVVSAISLIVGLIVFLLFFYSTFYIAFTAKLPGGRLMLSASVFAIALFLATRIFYGGNLEYAFGPAGGLFYSQVNFFCFAVFTVGLFRLCRFIRSKVSG